MEESEKGNDTIRQIGIKICETKDSRKEVICNKRDEN